MSSLFRKVIWLLRRRNREQDLEAELRFHLEETAEDLRLEGATPEVAARAAQRDFGNVTRIQEDARGAWSWNWLDQLRQDASYALRGMRRNPLFTAMAALSLALGIGANTAIASFLDALLLRSLPVAEPHRLAVLNWHNSTTRATVSHTFSGNVDDDPKYGLTSRIFPYPAFEELQKSQGVFSSLFGYLSTRTVSLLIHGQASTAPGEFVSGGFFQGLELVPAAGRLLQPDDDSFNAAPMAVLAYGMAESQFGSAAAAVGQSIAINNVPFTVAGVAPPGFDGVDPSFAAKFFIPVHTTVLVDFRRFGRGGSRRFQGANDYWLEMMGRLRPGISRAQAEAQLAASFHAWVQTTATTDFERAHLPGFHLTDGATGIDTLRRVYSQPFFLIWIMVGIILAIACANIANLLLARAASRRREMAVRLGIGAGKGRVVRQLLTESVLLAALGGALGICFAGAGIRLLALRLDYTNGAFRLNVQLNWRIFALSAALSILTGLLFGLVPALEAAGVDVMPALRGGRTEQPHTRPRFLPITLSQTLIAAQIALSTVLLVGAGWFVRTLDNLQSVQLGFNRENILLFKVNARQAGHRDPEITTFYRNLQLRLASIPGVRSATVSNSPLIGEGVWGAPVVPFGHPEPHDAPSGHGDFFGDDSTRILTAGPSFFATMQIPLVAGREFDEHDGAGSPPVAVVNQAWAAANLQGRNPIGEQIVLNPGKDPVQMEIVGVAKNARYGDIKDTYAPIVYMSFWQNLYRPPDEATYALRSNADPLALASAVRELVRQADSRIPVTGLETQAAMIDGTMTGELTFAGLGSVFAMLALAIACVGLYGTIAHTIGRRTNEIGIRIALGASRPRMIWLVMQEVTLLAVAGLFAGAIAAVGLSRLVQSLLFGVRPADPITMAAAVSVLLSAAGIAAYIPARRAARIEPVAALRNE